MRLAQIIDTRARGRAPGGLDYQQKGVRCASVLVQRRRSRPGMRRVLDWYAGSSSFSDAPASRRCRCDPLGADDLRAAAVEIDRAQCA